VDVENEEAFLFQSAVSRATSHLVLSYPQTNERGDLNLRSLFLDPDEAALSSPAVRPRALRAPATSGPSVIADAGLLQVLAEKYETFKPTALESYLQCAFQFFGRSTLALQAAPLRPEKRLDFLVRGNIVHDVLAEWFRQRPPIDALLYSMFEKAVQKYSIPSGYHTAFWRETMRQDLRNFIQDTQWPAGFESVMEQSIEFALDSGVRIKGRADRIDSTPDGVAFVIDYKYSKMKSKARLAEPNLLQGPLYLLGVERALKFIPGGMLYCTLGGDTVTYGGWSDRPLGDIRIQPLTREWMEGAASRSASAAAEIAAGRTIPAPADPGKCRFCDLRDVCRYAARAQAVAVEGA
jgi:RecB family exonuclease